jgi:hypothetical protein
VTLSYRIHDVAAPSATATVVITTPQGAVVVEVQARLFCSMDAFMPAQLWSGVP